MSGKDMLTSKINSASLKRGGNGMSEQIDTVVRFHDVSRLVELQRCVFSLVGQSYRPLNIILATQRFSENDIYETRKALAALIDAEEDVTLAIVNWDRTEPEDARSELLNLGLLAAEGRYLAFLDYDDVLYPEAYELLVSRLKESAAAIAFAAVRIMRLDVYERYLYTTEEIIPGYRGAGLIDLLRNNFCPLHSYVIDRKQMAGDLILFEATMTMQEDYDWLLRLCARFTSDFSLVNTRIGDYYYKTDGSNTVPTVGGITKKEQVKLDAVITAMEVQRRMTVVSDVVQKSLGISEPNEKATIRDVIDRVTSGR